MTAADHADRRAHARHAILRRALIAGSAAAALIVALAGLAHSTAGRGAPSAAPGAPTPRRPAPTTPAASASPESAAAPAAPPATHFVEAPAGRLPAAVQDAATAVTPVGTLLAGGLDAHDLSSARIERLDGARPRVIGRLTTPVHDAPAVAIGGLVYLFGGGDGVRQHREISSIDPRTGTVQRAGTLPAASSDAAAAVVRGVAYVVGGYTGSRWLDGIVAWRPGGKARVVARLPVGLRYAAVAAAGDRIVIAGGTVPSGAATRGVLIFDTRTRQLLHGAPLPHATTHAAAAPTTAGVLVLGGRGSATGSLSNAIVLVDPVRRTTHAAGRLRAPRADLAALGTDGRVLLVGGRDRHGATGRLSWVAPAAAPPSAAPAVGNVYAATAAGRLTGAARHARALVYVPNGGSDTVTVIDQRTLRIAGHYRVGHLPQHVTPSWDLTTLWVSNNLGGSLQAFDPTTGKPVGRPVPVADPYNLYFTPDGRSAIVVEEARQTLAFRDPHTWRIQRLVRLPCAGVDHLDFSADGRSLLASCEFSGDVVRLDLAGFIVHRPLRLASGAMPQDVKLSPDGRVFYVAEMMRGGVYVIDATGRRVLAFIATGAGAHGLYPSRDTRRLYVTNRSAGTVSVLRFADRKVIATWAIPGGSPDMGGVSADGRTLWLSGRYNDEVYAIDTRSGRLRARIPVDRGPHGLAVWPQTGRYSLGHTGILR